MKEVKENIVSLISGGASYCYDDSGNKYSIGAESKSEAGIKIICTASGWQNM